MRPNQLRHFQTLYEREGENLPRATLQIRLRPGFDAFDDLDESVVVAIEELEGLGIVTGFGNEETENSPASARANVNPARIAKRTSFMLSKWLDRQR